MFTKSCHARIHHPTRGIQVSCAHLKRHRKDPYAQPSEPILFPKLRIDVDFNAWWVGDSGNLVNPFTRVTHQTTGHSAALRDSESLGAFTRAWLSLITLTFRALGRNGFVSAPGEGIALR